MSHYFCDVSPVKKESLAKWIGIAYHPKTLIQTSRPLEVTLPKFHQTEEKLQHAQRKLNVKVRSAHHRKIRLDQASNYQKTKEKSNGSLSETKRTSEKIILNNYLGNWSNNMTTYL